MEKSKILEELDINKKLAIERENIKNLRHKQFVDYYDYKVNWIDNLGCIFYKRRENGRDNRRG